MRTNKAKPESIQEILQRREREHETIALLAKRCGEHDLQRTMEKHEELHAFVTVWPNSVQFRDSTGVSGGQPLTENRVQGLGTLFAVMIDRGITSIEIRVENSDD